LFGSVAVSEPFLCNVESQLSLETSQLGGAAILRVAGELGTTSVGSLIATVEDLLDGSLVVLVVDLHDLTGLEEAGVAAFDQLDDRARGCGTALRIITNRPDVLSTLLRGQARLDVRDTSGRLCAPRPRECREASGLEWPSTAAYQDCGGRRAALLDHFCGSVREHSIVGVGEPSVGRLERLGCRFTPIDPAAPSLAVVDPAVPAMLELRIARYVDKKAAATQWKRNSDAERAGATSRDLPIGAAPAVLVERAAESALIASYRAYTVTVVLPATTPVPRGRAAPDALVDLVQRVLPRVVPT
jgi:anti-anti-sigma regulatory factor